MGVRERFIESIEYHRKMGFFEEYHARYRRLLVATLFIRIPGDATLIPTL
ncbi:MAG: hypothetical protein FGF53_04570 [Candidatus Brockarchaeota archaeon]|nr:hypothetical protein [Candidatus Brockarchaeota archaeon]MBO3808981.1 hypothetical protein [Candidatus Brockarchaeota archaeon]